MKRKERKIKNEKKRKKREKKIWKTEGFEMRPDDGKKNRKENATDAVPWRSAQRGARDAWKMRYWYFLDTDAEMVNRTKEGQGVKTEAENPKDKLQLYYWSWRAKLKDGRKFGNHASYTAGDTNHSMSYSSSSELE